MGKGSPMRVPSHSWVDRGYPWWVRGNLREGKKTVNWGQSNSIQFKMSVGPSIGATYGIDDATDKKGLL